ncbi:MAG: pyrroline-5-carboxylate reductase [Microthrixaceae bacterium]
MIPLQFLGGGRMAEALLTGLLEHGISSPGDVFVVEVSTERRGQLEELFPGVTITGEPVPCEGLVLATKPNDALHALGQASAVGVKRVLSIAAGVSLGRLEGAAGADVAVVRAMPNTPSLVAAGASALCGGSAATDDDLQWAETLLGSVGIVERVPESQMDAVTGLSGSGPAYVFLLAEAMVEGGVSAGLPRDVATRLTEQTLLGSARLLSEGDSGPEELRAAVTSPGGTTAAGLRVLEQRAAGAAFMEAIGEAARRSAELDTP